MILFEKDWLRFPTAIADYSTTNKSFLRMVSLYQRMGIKNCLFPLALLQPELAGVDPHDENLDNETKMMIVAECRWNYWYFVREVVRIPPASGPTASPYQANRGNIALIWSFLNHIDIALIQPRQTGKSVSTDCIMVWVIYIGASNTAINMLTKDHKLRTENVERLKKIRDYLPGYIVNMTARDADNQTDLTCKALGNRYITGVGQTSESGANNLGRGLSSPVAHVDEGPFIRFIGTTIPAALAAGTAARDQAKEWNQPYGNIFTTTAGKKDDRDGRFMYDLIHNGAVWTEKFYDAGNAEALTQMVRTNCAGRKLIINATFNHRQLGKTDAWLREAIANTAATPEEANRDFFNIWTSGSQSSPLTPEQNERILKSEIDPKYSEISANSYIIRWYIPEDELETYMAENDVILGLDTSDAIGRDAIALLFINSRDLSTVGAATVNETNLILFARFLASILIKYTNVTLIPERKSSAPTMIDALLIELPRHGIDPFKRIFNHVVDKRDERPKDFDEVDSTPLARRTQSFYDKWKRLFGFNTSSGSRELLYSTVFQNAAKEAGHLIRDRILSDEIRGLVIKNGRIDHGPNSHDDHVIAWLMANWLLTHSKHLQHYGINTNQLMSKVHHQGRVLTPEEEHEFARQEEIRKQIDLIYEKLKTMTDEWTIAQYEAKLYALNSQVKLRESEALSIDALLQQAAESRQQLSRKRAVEQRRNMEHNGSNNGPFGRWSRGRPHRRAV